MRQELTSRGLIVHGTLRHLAVSAVAMLLVVGCSRIQFAYRQLNWFLPYYVETYMPLTDEQRSYVQRHVEELLAWHCATQLTAYADLLREASGAFQAGRMPKERLEEFNGRIELLWVEVMRSASPAIAGLLATASEEQVEKLLAGFEERNARWLSELTEHQDEELREEYRDRMTSELEWWFGPLRQVQQDAVHEWSGRFTPLGKEGLSVRAQRHARLGELVRRRGDEKALYAGIEELLANPELFRTRAYKEMLDHNKEVTIELVVLVSSHLSQEQREHLARRATAIARDLDQLACEHGRETGAAELIPYLRQVTSAEAAGCWRSNYFAGHRGVENGLLHR